MRKLPGFMTFAFSTMFIVGSVYSSSATDGKSVFDKFCAECHSAAPSAPGTQRLAEQRGKDKALLERRNDLSREYIRTIVRGGFLEMPAYLPTEVSEVELNAMADYLAKTH